MAKASKKSAPKKAKKSAPKAKGKPAKAKAAKAPKAKAVKKPVAAKKPVKKLESRPPVAKEKATRGRKRSDSATETVEAKKSNVPNVNMQLNIFPIINQRPIAHKPAKGSVVVNDDKTRYSDEELREFETLINKKLNKAKDEFKILKDTLNRANDEGTDSTSGGNTKVLEDGAETAEKENLSQLAARQLKYITNLENALVRIKNGTYGICTVTGKLIPKERLIAVPHTTQSIEAKMMKKD
jgi:RNA polymerase-binding transcription factor DksA